MALVNNNKRKIAMALKIPYNTNGAQPTTPVRVPDSKFNFMRIPCSGHLSSNRRISVWLICRLQEDRMSLTSIGEGQKEHSLASHCFHLKKYELNLLSNDGILWALQDLNLMAPFTTKTWKILANVMNEEIKECRKSALLTNSPMKRALSKSWAMYLFVFCKYTCQEQAIICVRSDMVTGLGREAKHNKI